MADTTETNRAFIERAFQGRRYGSNYAFVLRLANAALGR